MVRLTPYETIIHSVRAAGVVAVASMGATGLSAQVPVESEVRQIIMFSFLPGQSAEALTVFREEALPLYERNHAMLSFRGFREVESPTALDLIVVSAFAGMAGMDASNEALRTLATQRGTSIGDIYGRIAAKSSGHTDQFVEMLPRLGSGDPASRRLTAFVWYRLVPGQSDAFERAVADVLVPWEVASDVPSTTGRGLVSDGWHYVRLLGFDSLGDYQDYWTASRVEGTHTQIDGVTSQRREIIVASIPALSIR